MCKQDRSILFVCTGNTCRSPMAEAILRDMLDKCGIKNVVVSSAGLYALEGARASLEAVEVLNKEGIDLTGHKARQVSESILSSSDLILTMTRNHKKMLLDYFPNLKGRVYTLKEYAYGIEDDIIDPFGRGIVVYKEVLEDIKKALSKIMGHGDRFIVPDKEELE